MPERSARQTTASIDGARADIDESAGCPHVDRNDVRCAHRFGLARLDQAMSVCFGSFHACPIYHRLNNEPAAAASSIEVTVHAQRIRLRSTGT